MIREIHFNNKFKVIQLCDTHIEKENFNQTLEVIDNLLKCLEPDLAIFTGDNIVLDLNLDAYDSINEIFAKYDIKWLLILGNHDGEFTNTTRKEIIEKCSKLSHCITENSENNGRYGDTIIRLFSNEKLVFEIVGIDSGDYQKIGLFRKYANILDEQTKWFMGNTNSKAKFVYFHIPQREFIKAFNKGDNKYIYGSIRENIWPSGRRKIFVKGISAAGKECSFFKKANDGTLKAIFVGHDHLNDANTIYEGVHLVYGQKTGHGGYNCLERGFDDNMGVTVLTINKDSSFKIYPVKYSELVK